MVSYTKCCRLCLKDEDDEFLQKIIFQDIAELYRNIYLHFDVLISEVDELSTKVCQECASKVYDFAVFYNAVQHNQQQLKLCMEIQNKIPELKQEDDDCVFIKVETDHTHTTYVPNSENSTFTVDSNELINSTRKRSTNITPTISKNYDTNLTITPLSSLNFIQSTSNNYNIIAAIQDNLNSKVEKESYIPNNIITPTKQITENNFKIIDVKSLNNSNIPSFFNEMTNSIHHDKETSLNSLQILSPPIKIRQLQLSDSNKNLLKRYKCKNSYVKLKRLSTLENSLNQINLLIESNVSGLRDQNIERRNSNLNNIKSLTEEKIKRKVLIEYIGTNTVLKNMNKNDKEQTENNSEKLQKKNVTLLSHNLPTNIQSSNEQPEVCFSIDLNANKYESTKKQANNLDSQSSTTNLLISTTANTSTSTKSTQNKLVQLKLNTIKQPIINSLLQLPQNVITTATITKTLLNNMGEAPVELYTSVHNNKISEPLGGMIPTVNSTSTRVQKGHTQNNQQEMPQNSQPEKRSPYLFNNSTARVKILTVPELNQKASNNQLLYNKLPVTSISVTPSTTSFSQISSDSIQPISQSQHHQISNNNLKIDATNLHAKNSINKPRINDNISVRSENQNQINIKNLATAKRVQNIKCCIENCNAKQIEFPNLAFYRFPRNEVLRNIWMENCKIISLKGIRSHFVCGKHFERKCLGGGNLRHYSIPTVFFHPIKNLNCFLVEKRLKSNIIKCSVNECNGTNTSKRMFRFPPQKLICDQWVKAIGFQIPYKTKNKFVCEKHFEKSLILKQKLKKNSLPSLHLANPLGNLDFSA